MKYFYSKEKGKIVAFDPETKVVFEFDEITPPHGGSAVPEEPKAGKKKGRPKATEGIDDPLDTPSKRTKLTGEQRLDVLDRLKNGDGIVEIAKDFGVSGATIYMIKRKAVDSGELVL